MGQCEHFQGIGHWVWRQEGAEPSVHSTQRAASQVLEPLTH